MKGIISLSLFLFLFLFLGTAAVAQKNETTESSKKNNEKKEAENKNSEKNNQDAQEVHITPGSSGVKRSIGYKFISKTAETDPGKGLFSYDNESVTAVKNLYVNDIDLKGEDQTKWYSTWDKETGASGRGKITVADTSGKIVTVFYFTAVFKDGDGYWKFPVEYVSGNLPVDGSVYYYVFDRIAHKEEGENDDDDDNNNIQVTEVAAVTAVVAEEVVNPVTEVAAVVVADPVKPVTEVKIDSVKPVVAVAEVAAVTTAVAAEVVIPVTGVAAVTTVVAAEVVNPVTEVAAVIVAEPVKPAIEAKIDSVVKPVVAVAEVAAVTAVVAAEVVPPVTEVAAVVVADPVKPVTEVKIDSVVKPVVAVAEVATIAAITTAVVPDPVKPIAEVKPEPVKPDPDVKPAVAAVPVIVAANDKPKPVNTTPVAKPVAEPKPVNTTPVAKPVTDPKPVNPVVAAVPVAKADPVKTETKKTENTPVTQTNRPAQPNLPVYRQNTGTQSTNHRKWYRGIIEAGYALGVGDYGLNNFRFNFINAINIGNYSSIGLGIGYRRYYTDNNTAPYLVSNKKQIPVFLDFRTTFTSNKLTPYLALGIGNSSGYGTSETTKEGLLFTTSGGIWYNVSSRFAVFAGLDFEMKKLEFSDEFPFANNYKKNSNSFGLNIGISF